MYSGCDIVVGTAPTCFLAVGCGSKSTSLLTAKYRVVVEIMCHTVAITDDSFDDFGIVRPATVAQFDDLGGLDLF